MGAGLLPVGSPISSPDTICVPRSCCDSKTIWDIAKCPLSVGDVVKSPLVQTTIVKKTRSKGSDVWPYVCTAFNQCVYLTYTELEQLNKCSL